MTIAVRHREVTTRSGLSVFAFFHLNLAFSSIEEARRDAVIAGCYWPLLRLAEHHAIGLEVSGYTLEEIAARDPAFADGVGCVAIETVLLALDVGPSDIGKCSRGARPSCAKSR